MGSFPEIHIKYIKCSRSLTLCPSHVKYDSDSGLTSLPIEYSGGEN